MDNFITLLILTLCGLTFIIIISLLIFIFRLELRVWFHSRFGIRLFYRSNDIDKTEHDKLFDAFVSYSSKDETFVAEDLAPRLEQGDPQYKLCLHYRDFPVGAYIADTIVQAVESSRRTIMILSENFLKSEWCRFEFKSAHHQVLRDRRRRLIVILLGDVPEKDLDPDISLYLKTNTYLQWGDKLFWEKLRFALPDVPNNQRNIITSNTTSHLQQINNNHHVNYPHHQHHLHHPHHPHHPHHSHLHQQQQQNVNLSIRSNLRHNNNLNNSRHNINRNTNNQILTTTTTTNPSQQQQQPLPPPPPTSHQHHQQQQPGQQQSLQQSMSQQPTQQIQQHQSQQQQQQQQLVQQLTQQIQQQSPNSHPIPAARTIPIQI